jgi:hypothetical protein
MKYNIALQFWGKTFLKNLKEKMIFTTRKKRWAVKEMGICYILNGHFKLWKDIIFKNSEDFLRKFMTLFLT